MKLKKIIASLMLLSSLNCFASHITVDQQKVFSELDKLSNDLESNDTWALYIRKFGHEKIMIRFPKSPKLARLEDNKESYCIECEHDGGIYQLLVQPTDNLQSNLIQEKLKKIAKELALENIDHIIKKRSQNLLDVSYNEDKTNTHVNQRIIVTKENTFTLISKHPKSVNSSDEYFMHSFNILYS